MVYLFYLNLSKFGNYRHCFFPVVQHFELIQRIIIVPRSCVGFHYSALLYCGFQRLPSANYSQRDAKFC
jgi:hypothetical protein